MKFASNQLLAVSVGAGALIAAVGLGVQPGGFTANVQAAPDSPVHISPAPPPPPPPPPPPAMTYVPDYSTGQDSSGGGGGGGG